MKKLFLFSIMSLFLTSCMEAPMRYRPPTDPITTPGSGSGGNGNPITSPGTGTNSGSGSGGTTTPVDPTKPGYESCNLTYQYHTIDIGHFALCQNKYDPTLFKIKFSQASPSVRICLIPTFKETSGSSTYIGEPQCTVVKSAGIELEGKLLNNRPGYQNKPINAVMVMKEPLLPSYIACMHSVANWPANVCPRGAQTSPTCYSYYVQCSAGATTNTACYNESLKHKEFVCNDFKNRYSNSFADITLY